jgi:hypothetical protein
VIFAGTVFQPDQHSVPPRLGPSEKMCRALQNSGDAVVHGR